MLGTMTEGDARLKWNWRTAFCLALTTTNKKWGGNILVVTMTIPVPWFPVNMAILNPPLLVHSTSSIVC